ncbi:Crp/Fnr family transcriptional regulator [Neobacillus kokaensis]|uniref:Crp/Fnr family transcriptional regulator n=1 Tax=Neobacillus kokaensis TaxID=2759023 RepID=A0ABQ3MWF1_9BACI|nr:Crp/Fnr family transcriptional regulator [Neobacillus kokaensis]GHH97010.1 Crp/Fnr family transcriptional regulator [Neobacillus kokaensis]
MDETSYSINHLLLQFFKKIAPVQKVKAGSVLFQEKDSVQYIYLLITGSIALGRVHLRGKEFILKLLNEQEVIIEYPLFKANPHYQFYAKTLTDCELLMIKRELFEDYVLTDTEAMNALVSWLSTGYLKAQMKCQDLIMNGKKGSLYSILIRLCNSYGVMTKDGILIDLPLTHQELANLTYGTREVVQRSLKDLREIGVITYENQKFTINNLGYLKEAVDCQNCSYEICGIN